MLAWIRNGAAAMLVAACAASPQVQTTADPNADPRAYRTFSFLDSTPDGKGAITDARVQNRLRNAVAIQLVDRGYTPAAPGQAGELGVHLTGHVVPKQRALVVGRPGPYDYDWGSRELGGYDTLNYREGTLYIDLVDVARQRLVWRARVAEAFSDGYSDDNLKKLERALDEAFKSLPQRR